MKIILIGIFALTSFLFACLQDPGLPPDPNSASDSSPDNAQDLQPKNSSDHNANPDIIRTEVVVDTISPEAKPVETAPPVAPSPPLPPPTHSLTVDCTDALLINFTFGGRVQPFRMATGTINGQPSALVASHCPKVKTALNQKAFPPLKARSLPKGGTGLTTTCSSTVLRFNYASGDVEGNNGGGGLLMTQEVDIESAEVCLEVRNVINGLMLNNPP